MATPHLRRPGWAQDLRTVLGGASRVWASRWGLGVGPAWPYGSHWGAHAQAWVQARPRRSPSDSPATPANVAHLELLAENVVELARARLGPRPDSHRSTDWSSRRVTQPASERELNSDVSALDILQMDLTDPGSLQRAIYQRAPENNPTHPTPQPELVQPTAPEPTQLPAAWGQPKQLSSASSIRRVPTSRLGRLASFGGLGVGLGLGTITEASRRLVGLSQDQHSVMLSEANGERIVRTLCRVRGAALKIGQMLSIQDEALVHPQLSAIFTRVRESADYMPIWQMERVLATEFGADWRSRFSHFDDRPFAAASIGQVHSATLADTQKVVAVKIQYPGVADGIESDIRNLLGVLNLAKILPDGLFLDSVIYHMQVELAQECDYRREADCCSKMGSLLQPYPHYYVPQVIPELCSGQVFTTEMIEGLTIDQCVELDQDTRNFITRSILELLLQELFIHRYMQTDPNWANFLYNPEKKQIGLLDFGATREFRPFFVNNYFKIIQGAALGNRDQILDYSRRLKFLTGYESEIMNDAHVESVMILGQCFRENVQFDFGQQKTTHRMQDLVPVMLKHRLCPPPPEVYSLHRKMSGLFLLATKLDAKINCYPVWEELERQFVEHEDTKQ